MKYCAEQTECMKLCKECKKEIKKMNVIIDEGCYMPEKAHEADAGYDLRTPYGCTVYPHESVTINTGVHVEIPFGYVGMLKSKSGLNVKHGLVSEGVIDCEFTGSVVAKIYNHSDEPYRFEKGDKITQLVIMPIWVGELERVERFDTDTERGDNGFGSSGR